jgi:hypothetical protein
VDVFLGFLAMFPFYWCGPTEHLQNRTSIQRCVACVRETCGMPLLGTWHTLLDPHMRALSTSCWSTGKKTKQIDTKHTQEGHGHKPAGQARANRGMERGGGTRKHRAQNQNLSTTITRRQRRAGWNARNGDFVSTVSKQGGRSMSRRLLRGQDT